MYLLVYIFSREESIYKNLEKNPNGSHISVYLQAELAEKDFLRELKLSLNVSSHR